MAASQWFSLKSNVGKMSVVIKLWITLNAIFMESDLTEYKVRSCWRPFDYRDDTIKMWIRENAIKCSDISNGYRNRKSK